MSHSPSNDERFDAFNLITDPLSGHRISPSLYGPEPNIAEGEFMWKLPSTHSGWIPKRSDGRHAENEDTIGIPLEKLVETISKNRTFVRGPHTPSPGIQLARVSGPTGTLRISYVIAQPADASPAALEKAPILLMLHGVPTSWRWKIRMLHSLGKFFTVVAFDMLGMGRSSKVWDYTIGPASSEREEADSAWDWANDVDYVWDLILHLRTKFRLRGPLGFEADDWGGGILLRFLERRSSDLRFSLFTNPIWGDGYFVFEIGTIGNLANLLLPRGSEETVPAYLARMAKFTQMTGGLPQTILSIEKYMVHNRHHFNRYTESTYIDQYRDALYQASNTALTMAPNYFNLAILARRSSRLAPRQLQPFHSTRNTSGMKFNLIQSGSRVHVIWGVQDQMMPPIQMYRMRYVLAPEATVFAHPIPDADHFSEVDHPEWVEREYIEIALEEFGYQSMPPYLGSADMIAKGDEQLLKEMLIKMLRITPRPLQNDAERILMRQRDINSRDGDAIMRRTHQTGRGLFQLRTLKGSGEEEE